MEFLPKPKEVKLLTGEHALCYDGRIVLEGRLLGNGDAYAKVLQQGIQKETGMQYEMGYGVPGRKETGAIVLGLDETLKSQQYVLQVTEENITIQGGDGAGKDRTYFRLFTGYGLSGKFLREKGDRCHRTMAKGRNERFA